MLKCLEVWVVVGPVEGGVLTVEGGTFKGVAEGVSYKGKSLQRLCFGGVEVMNSGRGIMLPVNG